jgi:site-specific recombinase XerC
MPRLEKSIPAAFTAGKIQAILRSCTYERDKALCLFLLDFGVQTGELCALSVSDVDLRSGVVTVQMGKGQKARTTYIGAHTRKEMRRYFAKRGTLKPDTPAFVSMADGSRLTLDGLVQLMGRLRNDLNIYVLARLMGHADI